MEALGDPLLKEIINRFKDNSRSVTKDLLNGIGMFHFAARLMVYLIALVSAYTFVFVEVGYYPLNHPYGIIATAGSAAAIAVFVWMWAWFRRQYSELRRKYGTLFELFDKLGAK